MQVQTMTALCLPGRSGLDCIIQLLLLPDGLFLLWQKGHRKHKASTKSSLLWSDDFFFWYVSLAWAILPFRSLALVLLRICASEFPQNLLYRTGPTQR